jgi:NTP pyrophosphatase (non-canonical NTP hydrolase)
MISDELKEKILEFRRERDWERFHTPKDLAVSLILEASELLENFQWKNDREIDRMLRNGPPESIRDEIADIAIYLMYFCHDLGVNMEDAVERKLAANEEKYPAHMVRGSAKKYNEYREFKKKSLRKERENAG